MVSVVMAVHNGQEYLQEAIESILVQTFTDIELIVINDGSTDKTEEILEHIADKRVKAIHLIRNKGAAFALNLGIEQAKGNWIAIHDADDISCPNRLTKQISYLNEHPGAVAVGSFIKCIHGRNNLVPQHNFSGLEKLINRVQTSAEIRAELYKTCPLTHGTMVFSKKAFIDAGKYDPDLKISYDYDLWTRLVALGRIEKVPEQLYKYRVHRNSLTKKNQIQNISEMFYSCAKYIHRTCYQHLEKPSMAIIGPKILAEHLALAQKNLKVTEIVSKNLSMGLPNIINSFRQGKIDGVIILRNLKDKRRVFRYLTKKGMELNKNLFLFWIWFKTMP